MTIESGNSPGHEGRDRLRHAVLGHTEVGRSEAGYGLALRVRDSRIHLDEVDPGGELGRDSGRKRGHEQWYNQRSPAADKSGE